MKITDDETGRNLDRVSKNLQQPGVARILTQIGVGNTVSDEDIRYIHSVLEDAHARFTDAVTQL